MSEKMMAIVVHTGDEFAYEAVDRPRAAPGEVIVKIEAAGICAADRKIYDKNHPWELPQPMACIIVVRPPASVGRHHWNSVIAEETAPYPKFSAPEASRAWKGPG